MILDILTELVKSPTVRDCYARRSGLLLWLKRTEKAPRLVQLESPFAGAPPEYLQDCIRDCIARGETPYASHQTLTGALDDGDPAQRALGIAAGFAFRQYTAATVLYTDLGISRGMQAGIEHARSIGHPIETRSLTEWHAPRAEKEDA